MSTPTLATLANSIQRKPNKREAQHLLHKLHNNHNLSPNETEDALAHLYRYFMPAVPKKPKTHFDWCALAVDTKDRREMLRYVYVDEKNIVGTNGPRLHVAPNAEHLTPGFYLTNGERVELDPGLRYPPYEKILETGELDCSFEINMSALEVIDNETGIPAYVPINEHYGVNLKYLREAAGDPGPVFLYGRSEDFETGRGGQLTIFYGDGRTAVIMPMRRKASR